MQRNQRKVNIKMNKKLEHQLDLALDAVIRAESFDDLTQADDLMTDLLIKTRYPQELEEVHTLFHELWMEKSRKFFKPCKKHSILASYIS